jgi:hypothetical protein
VTWGTLQLQSGCVRSSVCACASKAPLRSRPDHHRSTRPFFAVSTGGWPRRFDNATAQRDFFSIEPGPYARGFPPPPGTRRAYDFRTGGLPTPRGALGGPRGPPREPPGPPRAPAPRAPQGGRGGRRRRDETNIQNWKIVRQREHGQKRGDRRRPVRGVLDAETGPKGQNAPRDILERRCAGCRGVLRGGVELRRRIVRRTTRPRRLANISPATWWSPRDEEGYGCVSTGKLVRQIPLQHVGHERRL